MNQDLGNAKLALVVDDSKMQRTVLGVLLKEEKYHVLCAENGAQAVSMYIKYQPDLVLMDINMPVMNGYEAARKIKTLTHENSLCPLIFITSMATDQAYIESIEAGGDGILVRPFSPEVFKAKIKSIQRISDLIIKNKALQQAQQKDVELAEQLMSGVIEARNFAQDKIGILKKAATLFSGDIQLTARCPNGDVNVLLGDFTGHGLRSSIGAIPLSETFRTMTKKGFTLVDIISQVNQQLHQLLPTDLFLAAAFVTVSSHENTVYIFNAGLPDAYIFDQSGGIKQRVPSQHPPIGVLPTLISDVSLSVISIEEADRVVLISDGILEARNPQGEMFDIERFERAATTGIVHGNITEAVLMSVNQFCQQMPQEDDISLIDIPCGGWQQPHVVNTPQVASEVNDTNSSIEAAWQWRLKLMGSRLSRVNPIPIAMNQIQEIEGNAEHWQNLLTILTELFVNSLDHGVLGLDSTMKSCADGFAEYFLEREQRLKSITDGFVEVNLSYYPLTSGGRIIIAISDSGNGFKVKNYNGIISQQQKDKAEHGLKLSGRGIHLVTQLCESLQYSERGNQVKATYVWQ
ncbi:SpoIIE family protein phosphatase [Thalassotalea sp. PP2-459]|uniref:ATP-binding SpoIIE family protein phosphatase n=1 Tax=Thalassotalea sp. PP2-459 TaxID=1742724 RepID=UPI000945C88A|nr:SpoIIE family protein phosphatase [Thalassotalea sp. PP2-459]OKY25418.1 histidine kinase [Thalassotalea sp. PP2-459]